MFKYIFTLVVLNFSLIFAATPQMPQMPQRQDRLDYTSPYAQAMLSKPRQILSTLISDPQNIQLILSSNPNFGGEAVPPGVFSNKPALIIYQGALAPNQNPNELKFMIAHELGHVHYQHMQKMDERMNKVFNGPPIGISGTTFNIFQQKIEERQADLYGQYLYKHAGYDMTFFKQQSAFIQSQPNVHGKIKHSSLSMSDSHFSMQDRFKLLAELS